ncbi:MAG TPA: NAD(P)/FAD-dependent oxidoreductase [Chloroflexota bacterium]|nr:NAD(P)/FAD-dependent oxidoreductase [Chloroflexota bacterium]
MPPTKRIVILGGGFAALGAARHLEAALPADGSVEVSLISRDNYLLFTPLLAEAATGQLPPAHVVAPLRAFLRRVQVWQGEVAAVDLAQRRVTVVQPVSGEAVTTTFDQLVLALGAVTSYHGVPGAQEHTIGFKTLADAARARAHVVSCFEQAALEGDAAKRRALLTFVVAGGGYSGVELTAALADFLRALRRYYPSLAGEPLRLVLAHHGQRLLEELTDSAAAYTLALLRRQGIAVRLGTGVAAVAADSVELAPGGTLPTRTVFWTAGVAPDPLLAQLGVPCDRHGAVIVDQQLAVQGHFGVWALGDCASVPNPRGGTYGPTAQNAEREAPVVAHNVLASLQGNSLRRFDYQPVGMLASLGRRSAVGEVYGHQFSGFGAWLLWRTVYLAKLPGWDRRARVGLDWALDFVFPPNIVSSAGALPAPARAVATRGASVPSVPPAGAAAPAAAARADTAPGTAASGSATAPATPDRPQAAD